jgi:hypothetical protein
MAGSQAIEPQTTVQRNRCAFLQANYKEFEPDTYEGLVIRAFNEEEQAYTLEIATFPRLKNASLQQSFEKNYYDAIQRFKTMHCECSLLFTSSVDNFISDAGINGDFMERIQH